ncbi:MAG: hypothetical protein SVR08_02380 [Spirochaetota bacterium]|nr:hypothetical protein [Spirochaetota bacterium]
MIVLTYIFFGGVIPIICIFFLFRKKISVGFSLGGILTSLLLGLIIVATLQTKNTNSFVDLLNSGKYNDAKLVLQQILQNDVDNIQKIDINEIVNPDIFERLKKELEEQYLKIANKLIDENKIEESVNCKSLGVNKAKIAKLKHSMRLLRMAESIGDDQYLAKENLLKKINYGNDIISRLEKNCN